MADSEQVSSTQNEVGDEPRRELRVSDLEGIGVDAAAKDVVRDEHAGSAGGAQNVTDLHESQQPEYEDLYKERVEQFPLLQQLTGEVPSTFEPEMMVTSTVADATEQLTKDDEEVEEEEVVVVVPTTNKAETEPILDFNSEPVECGVAHTPDSTHTGVRHEGVTVEAVAVPGREPEDASEPTQLEREVTPEQVPEPVDTFAKPEEAFESVAYRQNVLQEEKITTTHTVEPVAAPVVEPERTSQPAEPVSAAPVVEPVSAAPVVDPAVTAPVLTPAEPFTPPPVRAPVNQPAPAAPAPSHEPSFPPTTAAAAAPPLMQFSSVVDLLYWRDVKNTGVVFGALLLLLLSLSACSIISVLSYVALALLSVTVTLRIYKGVLQAIQKSDEGHPFRAYLDQEIALSQELVHKYSDVVLERVNAILIELRRLFLVEDLVDSLKFAVIMWILTYVGALFNGLTLLILGLVGVFTLPIVYEKHQTQIDHYIALVNKQIKDITGKIQAKIPGAKKKAE
ncbi:reticulon-4b isoform X2 [Brachyhypopomus gauderio]|uniref:reticulon-4b isoform X2 n=1 Tax=Brachyhypopomus gauderio TaxID=698409 RepID=UPI0040435766